MASAVHRGKIASWLSKVFELDSSGLNWPRAVARG